MMSCTGSGSLLGDCLHPPPGHIASEGQTEGDGQDERLTHPGRIHLVDEIGNGVGRAGLAAPQGPGDDLPAQIAEVLRPEVRVDVHVEVERTAGHLSVAVQRVSYPIRAGVKIEIGRQEHRHAQVGVDIDDRGQVLRDTAQPTSIIELEPGELRQSPVALIDLGAVGARARALALLAALRLQALHILFGVARAVGTAGGGYRSRRRQQLHEGTAIEFHRVLPRPP